MDDSIIFVQAYIDLDDREDSDVKPVVQGAIDLVPIPVPLENVENERENVGLANISAVKVEQCTMLNSDASDIKPIVIQPRISLVTMPAPIKPESVSGQGMSSCGDENANNGSSIDQSKK